jgi:hypothetical protein
MYTLTSPFLRSEFLRASKINVRQCLELEFSKVRELAKFRGKLCDLIFEKCEFFQATA